MKFVAVICLAILTLEPTTFEQARRLGTGKQRAFFMFSTSAGKYTIRHDGLGEIASRRIGTLFHLKLGMAGRIEQVYFLEYEGDLLLVYEVSDGRSRLGYMTRLDQQTRKKRWLTSLAENDIGPCSIENDAARCGLTTIDVRTGAHVIS